MARQTCPSCGAAYNGKKCRRCNFEVFNEEFAHRNHTHQGEPLVIDAPTRAPIPRQDPFACPPKPGAASTRNAAPPSSRKSSRPKSSRKSASGVWVILIILLLSSVFQKYSQDQDRSQPEPFIQDASLSASLYDLYRDDLYTVCTNWHDGTEELDNLVFSLQNNSRENVNLVASQLVVNGYYIDSYPLFCWAEPGSYGQSFFTLDETSLAQAGIEQVQEISFSLSILADDLDVLLEIPQRYTFSTGSAGSVQAVDDSGLVLMEDGGLRIIYQGFVPHSQEPDSLYFGELQFFLENETDQSVLFYGSCFDAAGNSFADLILRLPSHTHAVCSMELDSPEDSDALAGLDAVTVSFDLLDGDYGIIGASDPAVLRLS